jgi:hypothetical protein
VRAALFTRGLLIKYNLNTTVLPTSTVQPKMLYVYGFSLPDWTVNLIRVRSATCTLNSRCYTIQCCTVLDTAMLKVSACQWGRTVYELYSTVLYCTRTAQPAGSWQAATALDQSLSCCQLLYPHSTVQYHNMMEIHDWLDIDYSIVGRAKDV